MGDPSHSPSLGAVGSLSGDTQVAGGTCNAPSLHVLYPGLPQFLSSQVPCNDSWCQPCVVALYPGQGGDSGPDMGVGCIPGADQLLQRWVPASLLPTQVTPAIPCSTPWVALPQSVWWMQGLGVGGLKGAWQRLCSGGLGGSQPGTYLVGRAQRRRWRCWRWLLPSPFIGRHRSADGAGRQGAVSAGRAWGVQGAHPHQTPAVHSS